MYAWKWSIGEPYYKSSKTNNPSKDASKQTNNTVFCALATSNDTNIGTSFPNREELDTKISSRESLPQRGVNPFLQNSYIHDVVNSDLFLKPINTTRDNVKSHEHT